MSRSSSSEIKSSDYREKDESPIHKKYRRRRYQYQSEGSDSSDEDNRYHQQKTVVNSDNECNNRDKHSPTYYSHKRRYRSRERYYRRSKSHSRERYHHGSGYCSDHKRKQDDQNNKQTLHKKSGSNENKVLQKKSKIESRKAPSPTNTIMVTGLKQHITDAEIREHVIKCGLLPLDIRIIRNKETGASRGFAFVEFATIQEATRWMKITQGEINLKVPHTNCELRATLAYGYNNKIHDNSPGQPFIRDKSDWFCIKCGSQNFKRRNACFKCQMSKWQSETGLIGCEEVSKHATKTLIILNLDVLTTEDSVLLAIKEVAPDLVNTISSALIGRDVLSVSKGMCYLSMPSLLDSMALYNALTTLQKPLNIDGKTVLICYCRHEKSNATKIVTPAPETKPQTTWYLEDDLENLAKTSASFYAKTPIEYEQYLKYYKTYYTEKIKDGTLFQKPENQIDATNLAAAVAQRALQEKKMELLYNSQNTNMVVSQIPDGTDGKKYPTPEVDKYIFDPSIGYFYDPSTQLYYDCNSQYYYNSFIQKYMYWDAEKSTYVLAPNQVDEASTEKRTEKQKSERANKIKIAEKIAKNMERWAKNINQTKNINKTTVTGSTDGVSVSSVSADICFNILEQQTSNTARSPVRQKIVDVNSSSMQELDSSITSEEVTPTEVIPPVTIDTSNEENIAKLNLECIDWESLICRLCKRKFLLKDNLVKHQEISVLHKKNLESLHVTNSNAQNTYRDRAQERRHHFEETLKVETNKLNSKYLQARKLFSRYDISNASSSSAPYVLENMKNNSKEKLNK